MVHAVGHHEYCLSVRPEAVVPGTAYRRHRPVRTGAGAAAGRPQGAVCPGQYRLPAGVAGAAEQFYRRVLTQDPCRTEAIVNLSNLLRANGQFDAAIALLIPAVAREPKSHELQLTLGSAWRGARRPGTGQAALPGGPGRSPRLCPGPGQSGRPVVRRRPAGCGANTVRQGHQGRTQDNGDTITNGTLELAAVAQAPAPRRSISLTRGSPSDRVAR